MNADPNPRRHPLQILPPSNGSLLDLERLCEGKTIAAGELCDYAPWFRFSDGTFVYGEATIATDDDPMIDWRAYPSGSALFNMEILDRAAYEVWKEQEKAARVESRQSKRTRLLAELAALEQEDEEG